MWQDRLFGGKKRELRDEEIMPGQWVYVGEEEKQGKLSIKEGDRLVGGDGGICPVFGFYRAFEGQEAPDNEEEQILRRYRDEAKKKGEEENALLMEISLKDLEETDLEKEIREGIGALEAICKRPRTSLRQEEERLLVPRCKRPSSKAAMILAAHSEDWESRTIWGGVKPKKIEGLIREEDLDIYENRFVIELVSRLKTYCEERKRFFEKLHLLFKQKTDYQKLLENGDYRRWHRLTQVWGSVSEKEEQQQRDAVASGKERLSKIIRRLQGLEDSMLMRRLQKRKERKLVFRETNVLLHDELYRKAGKLWKAWENWRKQVVPSVEVVWKNDQEAEEGYEMYARALFLRTLKELGHRAKKTTHSANETLFEGPTGTLQIIQNKTGIQVKGIEQSSGVNCRIVALAARIDGSSRSERWFQSIWQKKEQDEQLLVLHLSSSEPTISIETKRRLDSLGKEGEGKGVMFVKAAPWDLESLERLMRALRWVLWEPFYMRYPPYVPLSEVWKEAPNSNGFYWEGKQARLKVPQDEHRLTDLKRWISKHRQIASVSRNRMIDVESEWEGLEKSNCYLDLLLHCPVCNKKSEGRQFEGRTTTFHAVCGGCGSDWGTRECRVCKKKYPCLNFPKHPQIALKDLASGKIERERMFGGDVLSIPLEGGAFLCPHCGGKS